MFDHSPERVALAKRQLEVLYNNTGFGFQPMVARDGSLKIVLCALPRDCTSEEIAEIRCATQCESLEEFDFIGRDFLIIDSTDYTRRFDVLNALFPKYTLVLWNKLQTVFGNDNSDEYQTKYYYTGQISALSIQQHTLQQLCAVEPGSKYRTWQESSLDLLSNAWAWDLLPDDSAQLGAAQARLLGGVADTDDSFNCFKFAYMAQRIV